MDIKISVIIPVYNAEKFLKRAIESVLIQPEADEIILIEDCSPDNSLNICLEYSNKYPERIKLYQHPDKENHGAGGTRNLGIRMAKNNLIAFLDADDFYLSDRFKETVEILKNNPDLDGVYGSLGVHFESKQAEEKYQKIDFPKITTVRGNVDSQSLFRVLLKNKQGHIHLNTLTVKRELIEKCGYFKPEFKQGQDMHLILKLAAVGRLARQSIENPIALRGVHENNRIYIKKGAWFYHRFIIPDILEWGRDFHKIDINKNYLIKKHIIYVKSYTKSMHKYFWRFHYIRNLITENKKFKNNKILLKEIIFTIFNIVIPIKALLGILGFNIIDNQQLESISEDTIDIKESLNPY